MSSWTFVTNHGAILALIAEHGQITARDISIKLNITERSVLRIIKDLEESGYITRFKEGRTNRYEIDPKQPLRHVIQQDVPVSELLRILNSNK